MGKTYKSAILTYNKGKSNQFTLCVTGVYYKGTPDSYMDKGDDPEFDIEDIELISGELIDLIMEALNMDTILEKCWEHLS